MTANDKRQPTIFHSARRGPMLLHGLELGSGGHLAQDAALS